MKKKLSLGEIAEIIGAEKPRHPERTISRLLTDSRSLTGNHDETIFIALATSSNDGQRYVAELCREGVGAFIVSRQPDDIKNADADFLVVPDTLKALQALAARRRGELCGKVVGITGSAGKTTVKEWAAQLIGNGHNDTPVRISRSDRSDNSQIGVPLTIWQADSDSDVVIVEAGVSEPHEMERLAAIIRPEIGVLTGIGPEHDSGFASREEKAAEKSSLFKDCKSVIYPADDIICVGAVQACGAPEKIAWSRKQPDADLFIDNETAEGFSFTWHGAGYGVTTVINGKERDSLYAAIALALVLGSDPEEVAENAACLKSVDTRLEVIDAVNRCLLVHDRYTADANSLASALDFMRRRLRKRMSLTAVLGDLDEGNYEDVAEILRDAEVARIIGIGTRIAAATDAFDGLNVKFFDNIDGFISEMGPEEFHDEFILVKGGALSATDRICDMLEARQHETVLEVNLEAVRRNYNFFRSKLKPETGIVAMVKAFGYGAGYYEIARTMQAQGAAYLAVAAHDEGVDLRENGITMPIMVLNPKVVNYRALFAYRLEPEIYSFEMLEKVIEEARRWGVTDYPVHIKLDTGMHRLGFIEEEIPKVVEMLHGQPFIRPQSVFSHLCAADDPADDDYTRGQFEYFYRCCDTLQAGFPHHILRHILNTTGIVRFPDHQCDMVRLGIGLYGIATMHDGSMDALEQVSSFKSVIISIRDWPAGTTVGYNRRGLLKRDSRIATVPVGYADGIDRHLGNGGLKVSVNGHRCPTVGNICMDVMMIDVTDVPNVSIGDSVEIFGRNVPADDVAESLSTITYEVLTSVSTRVKRIYYRE